MARPSRDRFLLEGSDEVLARLERVRESSTDLHRAWVTLGQLWANRQRAVFATNGLGKWQPVSRRAMMDDSALPLVDKGIMRDGLTDPFPRFSAKRYVAYGPAKGDTRVMNLAYLHTSGGRRLPKRQTVPRLTSGERAVWIGAIRKYVRGALR